MKQILPILDLFSILYDCVSFGVFKRNNGVCDDWNCKV